MKKIYLISLLSFLIAPLFSSCNDSEINLTFAKQEYDILSGDSVVVNENVKGVKYYLASSYKDVDVDEDKGVISFKNIKNGSQVMYYAKKGNIQTEPVILNLNSETKTPILSFLDGVDNITNHNYIYAYSSTNSSLYYSLVDSPTGISINNSSGLITFSNSLIDETKFKVKISSNNVSLIKEFTAIKSNLVTSKNDKQVSEKANLSMVGYELDFSSSPLLDNDVLGVLNSRSLLSKNSYIYDKNSNILYLKKSALESFNIGENTLTILTKRNMVNVNLIIATKIIKTPQDLASINDSIDSLKGYYVLGNDIDLSSYLSKGNDGYHGGKYWNPIGIYNDTLDGTTYDNTFKGTFDGNGYVIKGFKIDRNDTLGFNAGLFGYVYNTATIKNLGLESAYNNKTSSWSGGFVGVNEGEISNCYSIVNISNNYEADTYKIIGGFVGRNAGEISTCYSLGKVDGENLIGSFVGVNEGIIRNCYATKEGYGLFGNGIEAEDSILFDSNTDFSVNKLSLNFDESIWDLNSSLYPILKHNIKYYFPYNIKINNSESEIEVGDLINLDISIYPENLYLDYINKIQIKTNDDNALIDGLVIDTKNISVSKLMIEVSLEIENYILYDEMSVEIFDKVEDLEIINDFSNSSVEVNKRYKLLANVFPSSARNNVKWSLQSRVYGVSLEDDILSIDESIINYSGSSFVIKAEISNIVKTLTLNIKRPKYLTHSKIIYEDELTDINYLFPEDIDLNNCIVYRFNKKIEATIEGQNITIDKKYLLEIPNFDITFKVVLNNGDYYFLYASYLTHSKHNIFNLPTDAIELSSVDDFKKYFSISEDSYDNSKYENYYNKTFYLSSDIDFNNETIYSIGYKDETNNINHEFKGKIYGLNHDIKNAKITDSEKYFTLTSSQKSSQFRSSKYGVGFFGSFNGFISDINFINIDVSANSWCGLLSGTIASDGYVENVKIINSKIKNANDVSYSTYDGLVTGRLTASNSGRIIASTFNNSQAYLVGEKL